MGMILRIASSRIVGQGDIVGRSGYFSLNLSANSVMRGRLDARRTLKSLVADLRLTRFSELKKHKEKGLERIFVSVLAEFIANRKKVAGRHSLQSHHQTRAVPTGATDSSHRQRTMHSTYLRQYCSR